MLVRDGWESRQQGRSHGKFHSIDADQEFRFHCLGVRNKKPLTKVESFMSEICLRSSTPNFRALSHSEELESIKAEKKGKPAKLSHKVR